jgi:hypothetical protein
MNTDETDFYTYKECHQTESLWNYITTDHKEGEKLEDQRNVGENSWKSGEGADQRVQSLMLIMMKYHIPYFLYMDDLLLVYDDTKTHKGV